MGEYTAPTGRSPDLTAQWHWHGEEQLHIHALSHITHAHEGGPVSSRSRVVAIALEDWLFMIPGFSLN